MSERIRQRDQSQNGLQKMGLKTSRVLYELTNSRSRSVKDVKTICRDDALLPLIHAPFVLQPTNKEGKGGGAKSFSIVK